MKLITLLFLALSIHLSAFELREAVKTATKGDYIAYSYKQSLLVLRVAKFENPLLVVEEISAPLEAKKETSFADWLQKKAPGHSSWTLSEIDIETGKIKRIFSVDERKFLPNNPDFQFLPTLFRVELKPVAEEDLKRIGAPPLEGEMDHRKIWLPKIIFDGKEINPPLRVFRTDWPRDTSELSGKPIDLYLAEKEAITYLPYWIEIIGKTGRLKIAALDSGRNLASPVSLESYEQLSLLPAAGPAELSTESDDNLR